MLSFSPQETCLEGNGVRTCIKYVMNKKANEFYYLVKHENLSSERVIEEIYINNKFVLQHNAKDSICIVLNDIDTLRPFSYIFEDNADGLLPHYKQIVGFKNLKQLKDIQNKKLLIKNCGINQVFHIKN